MALTPGTRLGPYEIPEPLFDLGTRIAADIRESFDASADGQRFLVIAPEAGATAGATVVLDWTAQIDSAAPRR